jgi:hypothetical protein
MHAADLLQVAGALLILCPYLLLQFGRLSSQAVIYLLLNTVGAGILAVLAGVSHLWGFLLLESVWSGAGLYQLLQRLRHRPSRVQSATVAVSPQQSGERAATQYRPSESRNDAK